MAIKTTQVVKLGQ